MPNAPGGQRMTEHLSVDGAGGPVDKPKVAVAALVCVGAVAAGCSEGPTADPLHTSTGTSPSPIMSPADEARSALGYFKGYLDVQLPGDLQELRVNRPPLQDFRAATVISFVAPPDQVIAETCGSVDASVRHVPPVLTGYPTKYMFESVEATVDASDYRTCEKYNSGRQVNILIPKAEGATTYVLLYHQPYR